MPAFPPISDTERALLRAVVAAPGDDAPRLVYADWLDEHNQPDRALVIRRMVAVPSYVFVWNQSARAQRPRHRHKADRKANVNLKRDVSVVCREEWGRFPAVERVVVNRGFAIGVTVRTWSFLTHAADLFYRHPIRSVVFSNLWTFPSAVRPGYQDAVVEAEGAGTNHWPAALFPELTAPSRVFYRLREEAEADLSDRAVAFGRMSAGE